MPKFIVCALIVVAFVVACSNSESVQEEDVFDPEEIVFQDSTSGNDTLGIDPLTADSSKKDSASIDTTERDSAKVDSSAVEVPEGMLLVPGSEKVVVLGSKKDEAKANEKPEMKVVLNYDYFMGVHEVTCGEFVSVMKKYGPRESFGRTYICSNDSLPMVNVTYYDAVLLANARSAADSTDSVYTYTGTFFDEDGHCTGLNGLVSHLDRKGFRLPTEAEWVKAASGDFDVSNSWNNGNSGFETHLVCTQKTNDLGFCDFAGNVMEWINDWLGNFRDTIITNYVGAPDGGSIGERVVKGGAFNTDAFSINLYSRGDVYTVTSSTRASYVGFRLAYGSIPDAVWLSNDGSASVSVVNPLASSSDVYLYTKSYNTKLAFRNDITGNLAYIDYVNGDLAVVEIKDTINVYHPDISPDGSKVAFCTMIEGVAGESALYVRNLDETGSELVKLDVPSAAIPRWRVLENGDTVIVYVTNAGSNKSEATWKNYSTWQVSFSGGIFGIPRKIMDGSFHGGVSTDDRFAVTGAQLLRTRVDFEDAVWYNGEQACNVSMVQDGSKRVSFLDFGGKTGREYVGKKYSVHQYLLVADSMGALTQYIAAPAGYAFDHSEWAVGDTKNNIVASMTNMDGAHTKLVLVNLDDDAIIELAEGDELWHPSLWIKARRTRAKSSSSVAAFSSSSEESGGSDESSSDSVEMSSSSDESSSGSVEMSSSSGESSSDSVEMSSSSGESSSGSVEASSSSEESSSSIGESSSSIIYGYEFDLDSAGMYYNTSGACNYAMYYRYIMEFMWQYKDSANVVVIGSSRPHNGVMPHQFQSPVVAVNLAVPVGILRGSKYVLENYVIPHYEHLKAVIISLDLDRGDNAGRNSNNIFYSSYESYPGYVYDKNHNFWHGYDTEELYYAAYDAPGSTSLAARLRPTGGYSTGLGDSNWGNPVVDADSTSLTAKSNLFKMNMGMLEELIQTCKEHNVILVGVLFPMNPKYKETGAYGRHGLRRSEAPAVLALIENLSLTYPNFILFDENKMGDHDYSDEMARDVDHLNDLGAIQMTERLDSLLRAQNITWDE